MFTKIFKFCLIYLNCIIIIKIMNWGLISKYKNFNSIQQKSFLVGGLLMIAIGLFVSHNIFFNSKTVLSVDGELIHQNEKIVELISKIVKKQLESVIELELSYVNDDHFISLIKKGEWESAVALVSKPLKASNSFVERVVIVDNLGNVKSDFPQKIEVHGLNFSKRDWFLGATKHLTPYVSEVFYGVATPRMNVVAVAVPITDPKLKTLMGVLTFQVYLNKFDELVKNINIVPGSSALLVDQYGNIVSGGESLISGKIPNQASKPDVRSSIRGEKGSKIMLLDGEYYISSFAPVLPFGWSVLLRIPYSEIDYHQARQ